MVEFFAYSYTSKKSGTIYYLHKTKGRGGTILYYFSKEDRGAISKPVGWEVFENPNNGHPFLRKKLAGGESLSGGLSE